MLHANFGARAKIQAMHPGPVLISVSPRATNHLQTSRRDSRRPRTPRLIQRSPPRGRRPISLSAPQRWHAPPHRLPDAIHPIMPAEPADHRAPRLADQPAPGHGSGPACPPPRGVRGVEPPGPSRDAIVRPGHVHPGRGGSLMPFRETARLSPRQAHARPEAAERSEGSIPWALSARCHFSPCDASKIRSSVPSPVSQPFDSISDSSCPGPHPA